MTQTGELDLILPPQAIGEEMIKGKLTVKKGGKYYPVPLSGELFDFRLSPATWLHLDRTAVLTARAPAPWSLRRLLDRREAEVGLELLEARFELLYGMLATIKAPESNNEGRLRIADRGALFGNVPYPTSLVERGRSSPDKDDAKGQLQKQHAVRTARWIRSLLYYPSQLPIFRDWANREQLVIDRRVEFSLRGQRQTSDPFELENLNPDAAKLVESGKFADMKLDFDRLPLRGGVDYGFESANVYDGVRNNAKMEIPGAPNGKLAGVVFGALGGSGSQEAIFDEGRTIIITKTTQGRLDTLTIVRVGRIAMLWNHARHVIVYERSTRTAPRYDGDQPKEFEGLAALRKVKEYIEITQPQRGYPDVAGTSRQSGPLVGSFFETTIIPVRAEWGHDVAEGFVIALGGPVPADRKRFYPSPNVHLEFARTPGKGGKVSQLVTTQERLLFFSSTRKGEGGDPDAWRARADIDFPVTGRPTPPDVPYLPSFQGAAQQPDALPSDYGQSRFTVDLVAGEEAVNLMHGRLVDGIEARVQNVSLARGGVGIVSFGRAFELGKQFGDAEAQVADALREVALHASTLAKSSPTLSIAQVEGLQKAGLALVVDVETKIRALDLTKEKEILGEPAKAWSRLQTQWIDASTAAWNEHLQRVIAENLPSVVTSAASRLGKTPTDPLKEEARSRLSVALDVAEKQLLERMESLPFVPQRALDRFEAVIGKGGSVQSGILDQLLDARAAWGRVLKDLEARFSNETPRDLEAELYQAIHLAAVRIEQQLSDIPRVAKDALGPLFQDVSVAVTGSAGPLQRISIGVEQIAADLVCWIEAIENGAIAPFEIGPPDWAELQKTLDPTFLNEVVDEEFAAIHADLSDTFQKALTAWATDLEKATKDLTDFVKKAKSDVAKLIQDTPGDLESEGTKLLEGLRKDIDSNAKWLRNQIATRLDGVVKDLTKSPWLRQVVDPPSLKDLLDNTVAPHLKELRTVLEDANADVESLRLAAERAVGSTLGPLRNLGERIEAAAADELRGVLSSGVSSSLEMVRVLAQGPVTDTLVTTRKWVGYYYDASKEALDITHTAALFNDLGTSVLNGLSTQLPIDRIRDRLLPQLKDFNLGKLFPDFAGLKLEHLFQGFKIPEDLSREYDWVKVRHGFDKHRLSAWSEVNVDRNFGERLELFRLGPVSLALLEPHFKADSRMEGGKDQQVSQKTSGTLSGNWLIDLNGEPMLTLADSSLKFDEAGHLDFDVKPENLRVAAALQFLTDAISSFFSNDQGLTITPVAPGGVRAELSLPIPDIGTGAFTMTGITIYSHFDLLVAGGFEVSTGFWLSRPERPFGIAILFLGGGGWFGVDVRYRPPQFFETRVSIGLAAGAIVALNLGVAHGSAGLLFTIGIDFYRNWLSGGSSDVVISVGLLMWGEFSILAIASAYLRLVLRIEYRNGSMTGYGQLVLSIKICWCFTLNVNQSVQKRFSGGDAKRAIHAESLDLLTATESVEKAVQADLANLDW